MSLIQRLRNELKCVNTTLVRLCRELFGGGSVSILASDGPLPVYVDRETRGRTTFYREPLSSHTVPPQEKKNSLLRLQ